MKGILKGKQEYFGLFFILIFLFLLSGCGGITPSGPAISSFTASPPNITAGDSSTLSWSVTDADTLSINQGIGIVTGKSITVSPTTTTTYTLTAANSAGSTNATITITVNEEPVQLLVNGNFQTCDFNGWTVTKSNAFPKILTTMTSGCAAWMGDGADKLYNGVTNTASIQQIVDIPLDAVNPKLILHYRVSGTDEDGEGYDWMKVYINGSEVLYVWDDSGGWQEFQYDLISYTGTSITLKISSWTIDEESSVFYDVDNISITWD